MTHEEIALEIEQILSAHGGPKQAMEMSTALRRLSAKIRYSSTSEQLQLYWTRNKPTTPGVYLAQLVSEWPIRFVRVAPGEWKLSQNPEELYANGLGEGEAKPARSHEARWLGPLPEPEEG